MIGGCGRLQGRREERESIGKRGGGGGGGGGRSLKGSGKRRRRKERRGKGKEGDTSE